MALISVIYLGIGFVYMLQILTRKEERAIGVLDSLISEMQILGPVIIPFLVICFWPLVWLVEHFEKKEVEKQEVVNRKLVDENKRELSVLVGKEVEAMTDFAPIGKFEYENEIFVGRAKKGYIEKGTKIEIMKESMSEFVVEESTRTSS